MTMGIKRIAAVSIVSVALLGAGSVAVFADGGWKKGEGCHGDNMSKKMSKKLDLNDEQLAQFEGLMGEFKDFRQSMFEDKNQTKADINALLSAPKFDREKALTLMMERAKNKVVTVEKEAPDLVNAMAEFSDSLNPEQKEKFSKMVEKKMSHGWSGKHHGSKHHDGGYHDKERHS